MEELLTLLVAPAFLVGAISGLVLAFIFHWLAPAGTDTIAAGAWLVGLCAAAGLALSLLGRKRK